MKKVLIITYYWPPAGGPGVQRVLKFVKYLPKLGWQPIVLTVANGEYPAIDKTLEKNIPLGVKVFKTSSWEPNNLYKKFLGMKESENIPTAVLVDDNPSFKKKFASWVRLNLFVPDAKIGWKRFAIKEGLKIIKKEKPDLIFSSSPPPTVHLIASELAKQSKLKWVADFRDPWTDIHYYEDQPRMAYVKAKDRRLEKIVLNNADKITCISKLDIELDFANKTDSPKCINIPNGFDDDDFKEMNIFNSPTEKFTLLHLGAINKERNPIKLFEAVKSLRDKGLININNFQIIFVGNIDATIITTVEKNEIWDMVKYVEYLPHVEALSFTEHTSVLLLLVTQSQNNRRILPGKTFEYMRTGKYIFALGPEDGEVARIISETKTGTVVDYSDLDKIRNTLEEQFNNWALNKLSIQPNAKEIRKYSRKNLTEELVKVFDELVK
ncbi:MAG: glycosyltransferase [Melioribacteraceae bacterium]